MSLVGSHDKRQDSIINRINTFTTIKHTLNPKSALDSTTEKDRRTGLKTSYVTGVDPYNYVVELNDYMSELHQNVHMTFPYSGIQGFFGAMPNRNSKAVFTYASTGGSKTSPAVLIGYQPDDIKRANINRPRVDSGIRSASQPLTRPIRPSLLPGAMAMISEYGVGCIIDTAFRVFCNDMQQFIIDPVMHLTKHMTPYYVRAGGGVVHKSGGVIRELEAQKSKGANIDFNITANLRYLNYMTKGFVDTGYVYGPSVFFAGGGSDAESEDPYRFASYTEDTRIVYEFGDYLNPLVDGMSNIDKYAPIAQSVPIAVECLGTYFEPIGLSKYHDSVANAIYGKAVYPKLYYNYDIQKSVVQAFYMANYSKMTGINSDALKYALIFPSVNGYDDYHFLTIGKNGKLNASFGVDNTGKAADMFFRGSFRSRSYIDKQGRSLILDDNFSNGFMFSTGGCFLRGTEVYLTSLGDVPGSRSYVSNYRFEDCTIPRKESNVSWLSIRDNAIVLHSAKYLALEALNTIGFKATSFTFQTAGDMQLSSATRRSLVEQESNLSFIGVTRFTQQSAIDLRFGDLSGFVLPAPPYQAPSVRMIINPGWMTPRSNIAMGIDPSAWPIGSGAAAAVVLRIADGGTISFGSGTGLQQDPDDPYAIPLMPATDPLPFSVKLASKKLHCFDKMWDQLGTFDLAMDPVFDHRVTLELSGGQLANLNLLKQGINIKARTTMNPMNSIMIQNVDTNITTLLYNAINLNGEGSFYIKSWGAIGANALSNPPLGMLSMSPLGEVNLSGIFVDPVTRKQRAIDIALDGIHIGYNINPVVSPQQIVTTSVGVSPPFTFFVPTLMGPQPIIPGVFAQTHAFI